MARLAYENGVASPTVPDRDGGREANAVSGLGERSLGDLLYRVAITIFALCVPIFLTLVAWELFSAGWPAFRRFGLDFLTSSAWDPVAGKFGAAPAIYGTIVSSMIALVIAVPLALGVSIFLSELSPRWLRQPIAFLVDLLAAIPSVVYGLWGIFVLLPLLRDPVIPFLRDTLGLGHTPFFSGVAYGPSMLAAGLILAIMVLPYIASVSREVLLAVPRAQREAALALGATKWEMVRGAVLPYAKSGIIGGIILGLGRALGETMAVTMLIGNRHEISASLLAPGYTMASLIANEFSEASSDAHLSALMAVGFTLFVITIMVNAIARLLVRRVSQQATPSSKRSQSSQLYPSFPRKRGPMLARQNMDPRLRRYDGVGDLRLRGDDGVQERSVSGGQTPAWSFRARRVKSTVMSVLTAIAAVGATLPLLFILWHLVSTGAGALGLDFFTEAPRPVGEVGGGMGNAIVGTLILIAIAVGVGLPIGVGAGLYLAERSAALLARSVRFLSDVLNGLPSIVTGIFIWTLIVRPAGHFSALAGGIALGTMMIPMVARTTEEMLRLVPASLREAALALGYPQWRASLAIVLRTASAGIVTGALIALARIAGETAPLLFTAFGNQYWSTSPQQPIAALPLQIFTYAISPYDEWHRLAWAGALVLIALIFVISIAARLITRGRFAGASGT
ncbi:MAG TPA: phosphate ABC transporter permease subunit PstC [Gemmatimonadaceae bacterium]|nr:phosphate ABC transporter permease subunit PstC [Gemmatimonadaceae bacterium]